jgi:hypothetical protein
MEELSFKSGGKRRPDYTRAATECRCFRSGEKRVALRQPCQRELESLTTRQGALQHRWRVVICEFAVQLIRERSVTCKFSLPAWLCRCRLPMSSATRGASDPLTATSGISVCRPVAFRAFDLPRARGDA